MTIKPLILWMQRNPVIAGLLAALAVVMLGSALTTTWMWQKQTAAQHAADAEKHRADADLAHIRHLLYASSIAFAERELFAASPAHAERLLDECDLAHRDWEWRYLKA